MILYLDPLQSTVKIRIGSSTFFFEFKGNSLAPRVILTNWLPIFGTLMIDKVKGIREEDMDSIRIDERGTH